MFFSSGGNLVKTAHKTGTKRGALPVSVGQFSIIVFQSFGALVTIPPIVLAPSQHLFHYLKVIPIRCFVGAALTKTTVVRLLSSLVYAFSAQLGSSTAATTGVPAFTTVQKFIRRANCRKRRGPRRGAAPFPGHRAVPFPSLCGFNHSGVPSFVTPRSRISFTSLARASSFVTSSRHKLRNLGWMDAFLNTSIAASEIILAPFWTFEANINIAKGKHRSSDPGLVLIRMRSSALRAPRLSEMRAHSLQSSIHIRSGGRQVCVGWRADLYESLHALAGAGQKRSLMLHNGIQHPSEVAGGFAPVECRSTLVFWAGLHPILTYQIPNASSFR